MIGSHHVGGKGIDDAGGEPVCECHRVERRIEKGACRKPEGDVRHPEACAAAELASRPAQGFKYHVRALCVCADGEAENVYYEVGGLKTVFRSPCEDLLGDCDAAVGSRRYSGLVESERDYGAAVLRDERENGRHRFFLAVHGVYERLAVVVPQRPLKGLRV